MSQPPIDDDFQDRIQRILNEKKKDELREQYGMQIEYHSEEISPQAEGEWLDYITEFERQFENAKQITVRERIGNPSIRPLADIPESELEAELDNLFELLYQNNIAIDYIHISGMVSHFIYEEFHPNDRDDVEQAADEFLYALFKQELKDTDSMFYHIVSEENMHDSDGNPISQDQFKKMVADFYEAYPIITDHLIEVTEVALDGDNATADVHTIWHAIPKDKKSVIKHEGVSKFKLARSIYGGWDVTQANIADWNFS